jgi:mono/diheme cytochrome c family protein
MKLWSSLLTLLSVAALAGCGGSTADFRRYETFAHKVASENSITFTRPQRQDIDEALQALFGTPDEPVLPALDGADISKVMNVNRLSLAAGPVGSDEEGNARGLYREHCAHCHGITGDGAGPTAAFLNPYPRDYRKGQFKFKSTPVGRRPTHSDLKKIVLEGIPGTAMPSFKLLPDLEVEALVDYVKYLSIRGEVERALLRATVELEEGKRLVSVVDKNAPAEQKTAQQEQVTAVKEIVAGVVGVWEAGEGESAAIPQRPAMTKEALTASIHRGRALFYGTVANCVKCHGESALGDGNLAEYDDWTKEFIDLGNNPKLTSTYVSLGMLPPRNIRPRNLRQGIYRGGIRPIDTYWRLKNGIEGAGMPAVPMKPEGDPNAKGLTPDDIWDIVNYVRSLPYESISNPLEASGQAENLHRSL